MNWGVISAAVAVIAIVAVSGFVINSNTGFFSAGSLIPVSSPVIDNAVTGSLPVGTDSSQAIKTEPVNRLPVQSNQLPIKQIMPAENTLNQGELSNENLEPKPYTNTKKSGLALIGGSAGNQVSNPNTNPLPAENPVSNTSNGSPLDLQAVIQNNASPIEADLMEIPGEVKLHPQVKEKINQLMQDNPQEKVTVLFHLRIESDLNELTALAEQTGSSSVNSYPVGGFVIASVPAEKITVLANENAVVSVWPEQTFTVTLQESTQLMNAVSDSNTGENITGKNIKIAVLDTGINEENLQAISRKSFIENESSNDLHGHGTIMANTIMHIAPNASLINAKVLNAQGTGSTSSIIAGLNYAFQQGAQIINISFSANQSMTTDPINYAINDLVRNNVTVVTAAGNCNSACPNPSCGEFRGIGLPGNNPNAITVGAVDKNLGHACFSPGSKQNSHIKPDITAPGVNVNGQTGTSISTALTTGTIALLLEQRPNLNPLQVKDILEKSASDLGTKGKDEQYGAGIIDIVQMLEAPETIIALNIPDSSYLDMNTDANAAVSRCDTDDFCSGANTSTQDPQLGFNSYLYCFSDNDWFKAFIRRQHSLNFSVTSPSNAQYALAVYNQCNGDTPGSQTGSCEAAWNGRTASCSVTAGPGNYYVMVYGKDKAYNNNFQYTISAVCPSNQCVSGYWDDCFNSGEFAPDQLPQWYCAGNRTWNGCSNDVHNSCEKISNTSYYCTNQNSNWAWRECELGCQNSQCKQPACWSNSDCGTDGYTGNNYCSDNDVYRDYKTYTCSNGGTLSANCSNNTAPQKQQECNETTQSSWSASYCSGDLIQQSRTVNRGGCSNGSCLTGSYIDYQTVEDCNNQNYPDPFQFYCSGSQLRQKRLYHDYTCSSGPRCTQVTPYYIDDSLIENCQFGCSNGSCLRPNYRPTNIEYIRP